MSILSVNFFYDGWNALSSPRWQMNAVCRLIFAPAAISFGIVLKTSRSTLMHGWIDDPRPVFRVRAQTSSHWILSDVIHLHRKLLAALVSPQTVIEISFLPDDVIHSRMKTLPISDDFAHQFIPRER